MFFWLCLAVVLAFGLWVRFAPSDPIVWHVDPETVIKTNRPNQFLMRDGGDKDSAVFDMAPADLTKAFDRIASQNPGVTRLAGDLESGWATYVQRTKLIGFPDYISVKITEVEGGKSKLIVYSRSRFGRSDFGVNKARVLNWLTTLG